MEAHDEELIYLIKRANVLGLQGQVVDAFFLPTSATKNITDTMWQVSDMKDHMETTNSFPY